MKASEVIGGCQLEVDRSRGVLYVHSSEGITLVRVCGVSQAVTDQEFIDIVYGRELAKKFKED